MPLNNLQKAEFEYFKNIRNWKPKFLTALRKEMKLINEAQ